MVDFCPYCRSTNYMPVHSLTQAVRCLDCGVVRLMPRMDRSAQQVYLRELYRGRDQFDRPDDVKRVPKWEIRLLRKAMPDLFPGGRALDVGCSSGTFVAALKREGLEAFGLEPCEAAATFGGDFGLDIEIGFFNREQIPSNIYKNKYDTISFRESIYYSDDLRETFAMVRDMLNPGGYLYIKTLLISSPYFYRVPDLAYRFGANAAGLFDVTTLAKILEAEGFVPLHVKAADFLPLEVIFGIRSSSILVRGANKILSILLRKFGIFDQCSVVARLS